MLKIENLHVFYGKVNALDGVSLTVNDKSICTLIGANGVGKTTILRTISGLIRPTSGKIVYNNTEITRLQPSEIVKMGIAHCPEGRRLFPDLTVNQNLILGAYTCTSKATLNEDLEVVYKWFPVLEKRSKQYAGTLSGGEQQMAAIGRALMSKPAFLMLDEPSLGLAPNLVKIVFEIIAEIRKQGTSILLVEQNAKMALKIADYGYVMKRGKIALEGDSIQLMQNDEVKKVYLGVA